jgi:DUF971 family protein
MLSEDRLRPAQTTPTDIKLNREAQVLTITWQDGRTSRYPLVQIRKACPCATCREEQQTSTRTLLPILKVDPGEGPPKATSAQLVGRYALHIGWSDGHNTGSYKFSYLRSLDPDEHEPPAGMTT